MAINTAVDGSGVLVTKPEAVLIPVMLLKPASDIASSDPTTGLPGTNAIVPPASVRGEENTESNTANPEKGIGAGEKAHNWVGELNMGSYVI